MLMPVLLGAQVFSACSQSEVPVNDNGAVSVSFAFSLSSSSMPKTRMAEEIVQTSGSPRDMVDVKIVPYEASQSAVGVRPGDRVKAFTVAGLGQFQYDKPSSWYYYYQNCSLMRGTNAILFYGRATPSGTKAYNGSLKENFPDDMSPADISFELEQMHASETTVPAGAQTIADYLTGIARAAGWSTTTDSQLRALYLNFTGQGNQSNAVIAGSSTSVTPYVNDLKTKVSGLSDSNIKTAILTAIGTRTLAAYPVNLPDGAAALQWDSEALVDGAKGAFVPQTRTTTEAAITSVSRFVYPAELYYFGNSRLYTSNDEVGTSVYESSSTTEWSAVLARYSYKGTSPVSGNTRAVAVEKPIQYAVAQLQMTLEQPTGIELRDARNKVVTYSTTAMPLRGIIIGGQHKVGYDFKPQGAKTDVDHRFIYDKEVSGTVTKTLVLQSYNDETVNIILEFENKTGSAFTGKDGIIYPGTKFYLIGQVNPTGKGTGDIAGRVFTQNYTTEVTMKFNETSLAYAYNVMPNLLAPRLEIGIQLVSKWYQTDPTTIELD